MEEGLARAPCSSRPISSLLGSWGRMEHMGRRGAGTGEEGTRRAAPGAGEHRLGRQQLPGVDLVDHSGLGVSAEASFTPLCIRPLHTACWGPGRFRLQALDPRPAPCYRPHVPAPGASLWAGPASMGEDGGWSTEPPPAAASTGPKASPGRGEGFADSHAGQRAVTGGKKVGKWPERKNSHRPLAAGPYFSILLRSSPRARGL